MTIYEDFLERLQKAVTQSGNMNRFAESIDVQPNLITRWLKRERVPSLTTIQPVADKLGLRFATREEKTTLSPVQTLSSQPELPQMEKVGGGGGGGRGESIALGVYSLTGGNQSWNMEKEAPQFLLTAPSVCFHQADLAIIMDGHSMVPTIPDKAIVGVRKNAPFKANELYAAHIPYEGLAVKRVGADPLTEEFIFKSDNPNKDQYPDRRIPIAKGEKCIIGRVVWVMHAC